MKREKGGPEKPPRSAGQRSYGGLGATGRLPLSTDKAPRGRRGTLSPAAAAAGTEAAAAHGAGSSASEEGAEPRGLAPHSPHPSCSQRRPVGLWQQKRRSHWGIIQDARNQTQVGRVQSKHPAHCTIGLAL